MSTETSDRIGLHFTSGVGSQLTANCRDAAMQTTNPAPQGGESTRLHYRPVPTWAPVMSGVLVVAGALLAWREWRMDSRWRDERGLVDDDGQLDSEQWVGVDGDGHGRFEIELVGVGE